MEGFRFPTDMAPNFLPDFSTNNFVFSAPAIDREIELARHVVLKTVDKRPALQMESITCEASELLQLNLLRVPRDGPNGRFYPIKERSDLEANREILKTRLQSAWQTALH